MSERSRVEQQRPVGRSLAAKITPPRETEEGTTRRHGFARTAGEVFARREHRAKTMRAIAEACGILPGSLYHHFRGKEDITPEVMAGTTANFVALTEEIAARPGRR